MHDLHWEWYCTTAVVLHNASSYAGLLRMVDWQLALGLDRLVTTITVQVWNGNTLRWIRTEPKRISYYCVHLRVNYSVIRNCSECNKRMQCQHVLGDLIRLHTSTYDGKTKSNQARSFIGPKCISEKKNVYFLVLLFNNASQNETRI